MATKEFHPRLILPALLLVAWTSNAVPTRGEEATRTLGTIERLDPKFDELVPKDARVEILADGFDWSEGPVWFPEEGGYLLFSDVPQNVVYRYRDGHGVDIFLRPSGYTQVDPRGGEPGSNGLMRDPNGQLVLCQHGDRRVARLTREGWTYETLVDRFEGKRFNSPNDLVYHSNGDLYFTDPPYGLPKNVDDPNKEIPFQGVYRFSKDGKLSLLTKEMSRPNGIALSPDEKTLYVANSDPERAVWMAFPLREDGTIGEGRVLFDATKWVGPERKGLPDGMCVDVHGNLFATGPGGVLVLTPEGKHLGTFATGEATANCTFGGDGHDLYITADMYLARVRLTTRGLGR